MEDYKPNSHKSKELAHVENKKIEKVVTGQVTTKKKSGFKKLADVFIEDDIQNVKSYILMDVIVPSIKKAIYDCITDGLDMILNGGRGSKSKGPGSKVSYRSYYDSPTSSRPRRDSAYGSVYDYDELVFANRGDAERVLATLDEIMDQYQMVKVADLYDAAGRTPSSVMFNYGWTNINSAAVIRVREGYMIKLPRALPLD